MNPSYRRSSLFCAALLLATLFAPLLAAPAAAAVGVRANAGSSQVVSVGDTVTVDGSRSYTLSGNNLTYSWDFNQSDGIQVDATGVVASHMYNDTGIFTVTLTASDGAQSDTDETSIVVTSTNGTVPGVPNLPPVAVPPRTQLGFQNVSMVFDGTASFDPNGDNLTFEWDFDELDGLTPGGDRQGAVVNWTYYSAGLYNITMIVSDGSGSDSGLTSAIVLPDNGTIIPGVNVPPVAVAEGDTIGEVNTAMEFNANRSFDLDGDAMTFTWDFDSDNGVTQVDAQGPVVSHTYRNAGIYNVTLTATDVQGQDTDTLRVIVTEGGVVPGVGNLPPIAIITAPIPGSRWAVNEGIAFDGCSSFDPEGGNLLYEWQFPDESVSSSCEPTHGFAEPGLKFIVFLVQDEQGLVGANTVTVLVNDSAGGPINLQPEGDIEGPSTGQVGEVLNFTANFTDADGDAMNYSWDFDLTNGLQSDATGRNVSRPFNNTGRLTIAVSVLDGNHRNIPVIATHNLQIVPRETHAPQAFAGNDTSAQVGNGIVFDCTGNDTDGTVALFEWDFEGDGTFDYRNPDSGFTIYAYGREGNYTAVCRVTDNEGLTGTDARRVVITPAPNNPPVADAGPDKPNVTQGVQTFFDASGSDSDGNVTLFEWDFEGDGVFDWSNSDSPDVHHTYGNAGTYSAVLRVTDNRGARGTDFAVVTVRSNLPPIAEAGPDQSVRAGVQVTFSGAGSRDPEGSITKYSWDFDAEDGIQEDFTGVSPLHVYTKRGSYLVTLTVFDALGQSDTDNTFVDVSQTGDVGLQVDSDGTKEVAPEQTSSYLLTVKNEGDGTDTITLSLAGDPEVVSWYTLETYQVIDLAAGAPSIVRLTVSVPRDALVEQASAVTVNAASRATPTAQASVTVLTTVKEVVRVEATFASFPTDLSRGQTREVAVHVVNSGNREVHVEFIASSGDSSWLVLKSLVPWPIKPGKSFDFLFDLNVPGDAAGGQHAVTVTVSVRGTSVTDSETATFNVAVTNGFIPTLTPAALIIGIGAVAALLLAGRPARRR